MTVGGTPPRLALLPDFRAEGWPSMDLCADLLMSHLPGDFVAELVCPRFRRLLTRLPVVGKKNAAFNADRLLNRFLHFPRYARAHARRFNLFHVVDHSYAQLVHSLPCDRTGVYCHDLDAFRSVLEPARDTRSWWFRNLTERILGGLKKAAVVFHSTRGVGDEIRRLGLIDPGKLIHAPYGVASEFSHSPASPPPPLPWLDALAGVPWVLHVGSCIPRKRIDVLLEVVAEARRDNPDLRLVKVGGEWTEEQGKKIERLGLKNAVVHKTGLSRGELAEVYRRAPVVLVPSEAEGFGLPVIEALACGSAVVASDLPVLREVGGEVVTFRAVADVPAWAEAVVEHLNTPRVTEVDASLKWAARYTWASHAATIAEAYRRIHRGEPPCGSSS